MQTFFSKSTATPSPITGGPIAVPKERFSTIDYNELTKIMPTDSAGKWTGATATTKFANFPIGLGGGQYAVDKASPGALIKTERSTNNDEEYKKRFIQRKGLPSRLFEVDHIIPLALGGTDTDANKEVLGRVDHDTKTKVGAIAQSMYFAGKMSKNEALNLAINWRGKNVDGIQVKDGALVNSEIAPAKLEEWQSVPKTTIKSWWSEVKNLGKSVDKVLPENAVGEFGKGFVEGATLGWVNPEKGNYTGSENVVNTGARLAGNLASFLIPYKIIGAGLKIGVNGIKSLAGLKTVGNTSKALKAVGETVETLSKSKYAMKNGEVIIPRNTGLKILENAGIFTTMGQLSKQEQNTFEARTQRFLTDLSFGALMGANPQTLKGFAGLAAGTYTISALGSALDEDTTASQGAVDALLNTAIVVGLHGAGKMSNVNITKNGIKVVSNAEKINQIATKLSQEKLAEWGVTPKESNILSPQELRKAYDAINEKYFADPDAIKREKEAIMIAARQIWKGGLGREQRIAEEIKDMRSLSSRISKAADEDINTVPSEAKDIFASMSQAWRDLPTSEKSVITGTGFGKGKSKDFAINVRKIAEKGEDYWRNKPALFIKDDRPGTIKIVKDTKRYKNPEKNIRIVTEIDGKLESVAWVPDEKNMREQINKIRDEYKLPRMSEDMHKDALFDQMDAAGIRALPGKITYAEGSTKTNKEPSITFETGPDYWNMAKEIKTSVGAGIKTKTKEALATAPSVPQKTLPKASSPEGEGGVSKSMFAGLLNDIYQKSATSPDELISYLQSFVTTPISKEAKAKLADRGSDFTVGDLVNFFVANIKRGALSKEGKSTWDLVFNNKNSTYYGNLSDVNQMTLNNSKISSFVSKPKQVKTGEIKQEIPLEEPAVVQPGITHEDLAKVPGMFNVMRGKQTTLDDAIAGASKAASKTPAKETVKTALANRPPLDASTKEEAIANMEKAREFNKKILDSIKKSSKKHGDSVIPTGRFDSKGNYIPAEGLLDVSKYKDIVDKVSARSKLISGKEEITLTPAQSRMKMDKRGRFKADQQKRKEDSIQKTRDGVEVPDTENKVDGVVIKKPGEEDELGAFRDMEIDKIVNNLGKERDYDVDEISLMKQDIVDYRLAPKEDKSKLAEKLKEDWNLRARDFDEIIGTDNRYIQAEPISIDVMKKEIADSANKSTGLIKTFWTKVSKSYNDNIKTNEKFGKVPEKIDVEGLYNKTMRDLWTTGKMAGKERTIDPEVMKYSNIVKLGEDYFDRLPKEILDEIRIVQKKYPNARLVVNQGTGQGNNPSRFYNVFEIIRNYVKKESPQDYFAPEKRMVNDRSRGSKTGDIEEKTTGIKEEEPNSLADIPEENFAEYLGNVKTEENFSEIFATHTIHNSLAPLLDKIFTDTKLGKTEAQKERAITRIAEDFAQIISLNTKYKLKNKK